MISKSERLTKEHLEKAEKEGTLWLQEKHLGSLPYDYINCVMTIITQGLSDELQSGGVITMDEPLSSKYFEALKKEDISLLIFNKEKAKVWNLYITRDSVNKCPETEDPATLYVGGENLRMFCDERNIFYKSTKTSDGRLISGSNLTLLKKDGEDCRSVENEV